MAHKKHVRTLPTTLLLCRIEIMNTYVYDTLVAITKLKPRSRSIYLKIETTRESRD